VEVRATRLGHEDALELTGAYVLGALDGADRQAFEAHMAGCAVCTAEVRNLQAAADAIGQSSAAAEPSRGVRAALLQKLSPEARPIPATRRQGLRSWLPLAAAVLLATGAAWYVTQVVRGTERDRLVAAVLAAPDLARIDLAGQPAAPSAAARAYWSRSRGLVLTASNLPQLPAGRTYQLWVLTKEPAPMSAGLLKPDRDGRATMTVVTPVDMPAPVAMAVTIEPEGGVPAPTGDKYLVGPTN
jgi:anti-sigma-K factor RskA